MSRKNDRIHAFSLVFQIPFYQQDELERQVVLYFQEISEDSDINKKFIIQEFEGVIANRIELDKLIDDNADGWSINRISKTDVAILRVCLFEIYYMEDIPVKASINEAVEIAKAYSSDEAPAFINGILGKIVKLKPIIKSVDNVPENEN